MDTLRLNSLLSHCNNDDTVACFLISRINPLKKRRCARTRNEGYDTVDNNNNNNNTNCNL